MLHWLTCPVCHAPDPEIVAVNDDGPELLVVLQCEVCRERGQLELPVPTPA